MHDSDLLFPILCSCFTLTGFAAEGIRLGDRQVEAISVPPAADETTHFAAQELRTYLGRISGEMLPVSEAGENPTVGIALRVAPGKPALGREGFSISTTDGRLVITGACPRAVLYGVYTFLEHLGCRWCFPATDGEVIPRISPLIIPAINITETPSFSYRCFQHCAAVDETTIDWVDWMTKNRMNRYMVTLYPAKGYKGQWYRDFKAVPGLPDAIRKRGILIEAGHHSLYYWLPPEQHYDEHPDWYSMVDGERRRVALQGPRTQLCFSNAAMANALAGSVLDFIRRNPEADILSIYTNDGYGYCECPECRKAATPADAYVQFVNRVAEAVHREAPGKKLSLLSYSTVSDPPTSKIFSANTLCAIATWPPPKTGRLEGWLRSGVGDVVLYEYYMGSYSDRSLPGCWTATIADELRTIHRLGLAGVATQCELANWGSYSLNYWVCVRLLWNVDQQLEDVVDDYLEHYYGPAAPDMKRYVATLEEQGRMPRDVSLPESMLDKLEDALRTAEGRIGDDRALRTRLDRDGLSLRYLRLAWTLEHGERQAIAALQRADRKAASAALTRARDAAAACVKLLLRHKADRVFLAGSKEDPHEIVGHFYTTRYYEAKMAKLTEEIASLQTRPLSPNLALDRPATASSEYAGSYKARNAVDGRMDSAWYSAYSPSRPHTHKYALPQWLQVDLEQPRQVAAVVLRTPKQVYHYRIELSLDGQGWNTVAEKSDDVSGSLKPGLTHTFDPQRARYVRVTVTANRKNAAHIGELEVYERASDDMAAAKREQELERARRGIASAFYAHLRKRMAELPEARITETWPTSSDQWLATVPGMRERLGNIFHFPPARCVLNPQKIDEIELDDIVIEKVTYEAEPWSTVTANVYRPATMPAERLPALILPSGHGGSKSSAYNQYMGQMYAKAGCVVLAFDPIGEEERDERGRLGIRGHRLEHRIDRCLAMGRSTIGKMVYDTVRGIDYLVSRPDVEAQRIACAGHSLGGTLTEYVTAIDERIRVSLPTAWTCNFKDIIGELSCCWRPFGLLQVANDSELFGLAAPRCAVLVLAGGKDACPMPVDRFKQSTVPLAQRVFALFGGSERMAVHVTPGAGHQPFQTNRAALLWVQKHLGLPNWTREHIEAFPELQDITRVSAKLGEDKSLPVKEIERLVHARAVDCGVTLLPPETLRCISPERWASEAVGLDAWVGRLEAGQPTFTPASTPERWGPMRQRIVADLHSTLGLPDRDAEVTQASQPHDAKNGRLQELTFGTLALRSVLAVPEDIAPPWPCVIYLDPSRTAMGATERLEGWLAQGSAVLALGAVRFDDTAVLLGTSSTAYNVAHVLEAVDVLAAREDIDMTRLQCVSAVDDVGLLAAVLDERIRELTVESGQGTRCSFQGYRLNGIVPGLNAVVSRTHLMAAVAPRQLTICSQEDADALSAVGKVYGLLDAADALSVTH